MALTNIAALSFVEFLIRLSPYAVVVLLIAAAVWILIRQFHPKNRRQSCHGSTASECDRSTLCGSGMQCQNCHYFQSQKPDPEKDEERGANQ